MTPRFVRWFWPLVIAAMLGTGVALTLAARVPNVVDVEMGTRNGNWPFLPVALEFRRAADGTTTAFAELSLGRIERLAAHSELWLFADAFENSLTLVSGEVHVVGTMCVYKTEPRQVLSGQRYVVFKRNDQCYPPLTGQPTGKLGLEVVIRGGNKFGLMVSRAPVTEPGADSVTIDRPRHRDGDPYSVVWARSADTYVGNERRRVELLAYMWQSGGSGAWIWGIVCAGVFIFLAGARLLTASVGAAFEANPHASARRALGVGLVALALGMAYAVLVPPLQAPDEPAHLLAFADVIGRPALRDQMLDLARTGHADRLVFRRDERIRPFDLGRPSASAGEAETIPTPPTKRESVTTWWWWRAVGLTTPGGPAGMVLLWLRLANSALFALALGIATWLVGQAAAGAIPAPHMAVAALLLTPTLPFFAMHAAEYSVVTTLYVFVAAVSAGLWLDVPRAYLLGLPLGVGWALLMGTRRGALPLIPAFVALLATRCLLGDPRSSDSRSIDSRTEARQALIFWGGLAAGFCLMPLLATDQFLSALWPSDTLSNRSEWFKWVAELPRRSPWLLVLLTPIGWLLERAFARLRPASGGPSRFTRAAVTSLAMAGGLVVVVSMVLSLFIPYPELGGIDRQIGMRPWAYAREVLTVVATGLRVRGHDLWMSSSFWGGFGWLDAIPGAAFVSVCIALVAAGILALANRLVRTADHRTVVRLIIVMVGWVASLIVYALSVHALQRILHGRYVIGLYAIGLVACWHVWGRLPRLQGQRVLAKLGLHREHALLLVMALLHVWALTFILQRYF